MIEDDGPETRREERRRHQRFSVDRIPGVLAMSLHAEVLDLSLAGMAVQVPVSLAVGKRFAVRIGAGEDQLDLVGTVRWCQRIDSDRGRSTEEVSREAEGADRPRYRAGLIFHDILTERAASLMEFMERNVVLALDRQLFARLELDGKTEADLEGDFELRLRHLGLDSAVGETPYPSPEGSSCELELDLGGRLFVTPGRIDSVRSIRGDDDRYRIEVEFLDTPRDQREILRSFIRSRLS